MLTAIIVAGGSSQRMGFDKLFALLDGRPVVAHSIAAFEQTESVTDIILVGREERLSDLEAMVRAQGFRRVSGVIAGGARRQDSVGCGLERVGTTAEFVAVHDAARPLVRPELVERTYQAARAHGGAACAAPVIDTLKRADDALVVTGGVERENLFAVQTPQIFRRDLLLKAYAAVLAAGVEVTDEISAVERSGGKVVLVPNENANFKITYPADLPFAEIILRQPPR
jgi:2-C-methyl-D-erythritol 4-phosphate cytidylyltransferase